MPENTAENEIIPMREGLEPAPMETAKEKFERERLTRRQALKRFGMTSAMATFALFSVDDLAHMVGKAMQQRAGDNKVANQVAKEFKDSGIAFAGGPSWACGGCSDPCVAPKYYRCAPCILPCTGQTIAKANCDTYTVGTNKSDCHACCDTQWPLDSNNPIIFVAWKICGATC